MSANSTIGFSSPVPPVQIVSTSGIDASERLDFWTSGGASLFGPVQLEQPVRHCVQTSFSYSRLDDLVICRLTTHVSHRAISATASAFNDGRPYLKAVLQKKGSSIITQGNTSTPLHSGEWTVYDPGEPYSATAFHGAQFSIIFIPRERVVNRGIDLSNIILRPLSARRGFSRLFWIFVDATMDQALAVEENRTFDVAEVIAQMFRITLFDSCDTQFASNSQMAFRERVKLCISAHLTDPALSISKLADLMHCSKRYLHVIFRPESLSISEYILKERLERCRAQLLDPSSAGRSITDIAYSWGFSNSHHFGRSFRREFGVSPRKLRADLGLCSRFSGQVGNRTSDASAKHQSSDRRAVALRGHVREREL
jgi:AraC family transcriptional regulator, positive regulator of tynA and feaB